MSPLKFLPVARAMASMSKDPSTKVGAIAVHDDGRLLSTGYNGFPRGVRDDPERYADRAIKYPMVCHAESNVITAAARQILLGSSLVVTEMYPCNECAKQIIQAGFARVYAPRDQANDRWGDSTLIALQMFREAGVELLEY